MSEENNEGAMTSALADWKRLNDSGRIRDEKALSQGAMFWLLELPLTLERIYIDGSVLRWNEKEGRWRSYDTADELKRAKELGRA